MNRIKLLCGATLLAVLSTSALADSIEEKNLASGKTKLDPAQGYIYSQAKSRMFGLFLREPEEADRAAYQQDWEEAYAKARTKYEKDYKRWQDAVAMAKQTKSRPPAEPIEPTRDTFAIDPILLRDSVSFGPMYVFNKGENHFTYLNSAKPGTYVYYGPVLYGAGVPPGGQCYCMGSVKFVVKPGVITDLGNSLQALPTPTVPYSVGTMAMLKQNEERAAKGKDPAFAPPTLAYGVPASLSALPAVPAEFHASGKLNNFFLLPIDRMAPIAGVLGYRRDTVFDLRTGTDVPSPSMVTQVRIKK